MMTVSLGVGPYLLCRAGKLGVLLVALMCCCQLVCTEPLVHHLDLVIVLLAVDADADLVSGQIVREVVLACPVIQGNL